MNTVNKSNKIRSTSLWLVVHELFSGNELPFPEALFLSMLFEKNINNHITKRGMLIVSIKLIDSLLLIMASNLYCFQKLAYSFFHAESRSGYILLTFFTDSDIPKWPNRKPNWIVMHIYVNFIYRKEINLIDFSFSKCFYRCNNKNNSEIYSVSPCEYWLY